MDKLHLVFVEAGLELTPKELWRHPAVRKSAERRGKRPSEILLDVSFHRPAMLSLKDAEKRGRPDIAHFCALLALGSLLNKFSLLTLHLHTYENKVIEVAPRTRLPRNYNRFVSLIEQLLVEGSVPPNSDEPLLRAKPVELKELINRLKPSKVFLLSEKGVRMRADELAKKIVGERGPAVLIGCFQAGDFRSTVYELAHEVVAISQLPLDAWNVTAKVLSSVEDVLGLL
ncbi:MAG: 16S rRNA methyltransferase [Thermofilaceae archaeon]